MNKLICEKCKTESDSKFCHNCGRLMFSHVRSKEEIEAMINHMKTATGIISSTSPADKGVVFDLVNALLIDMVLTWCLGKSDITPLELAIGRKQKDNEKIKTLIEVARMGVARKVEDEKRL